MKKLFTSILMFATLSIFFVYRTDTVQAAWLDTSWPNRVKIEINPAYVGSTLTDFPVYFALSDLPVGAIDSMIAGCGDIRITSSDEITEIPREVVTCETTGDTGEIYFKGTLSSSATTTFYLYYGNSGASDYGVAGTYGRNNVWTNSYGGVWHMGGGTLVDSAGNVGNSSSNGGSASTDILTEGSATDFSGSSQRAIIPDDTDINVDVLSSLTYWMAVKADAWSRSMEKSNQYFLLNFAGAGDNGPLLKLNAANIVANVGTLSIGQYYMTGGSYTFSGGTSGVVGAIVDGATVNTTTGQSFAIDTSSGDLYVGSDDTTTYFNGHIDELRISKVVRTDNWLSATWDNMTTPNSFYFVGTEESVPPGGDIEGPQVYINNGRIKVDNGRIKID